MTRFITLGVAMDQFDASAVGSVLLREGTGAILLENGGNILLEHP